MEESVSAILLELDGKILGIISEPTEFLSSLKGNPALKILSEKKEKEGHTITVSDKNGAKSRWTLKNITAQSPLNTNVKNAI